MLLLTPPTKICGRQIDTHFMRWLGVARVLQSHTLFDYEKVDAVLRLVFEDTGYVGAEETAARYSAVVDFYNCGWEDRGLEPPKEELYNWERDSGTIWADFFIYVPLDLDNPKAVEHLHWWKFKYLFDSLPPQSQIKRLIQIRSEDPDDYSGKGMEKERHRMCQRKRAAAVWPPTEDDENFFD